MRAALAHEAEERDAAGILFDNTCMPKSQEPELVDLTREELLDQPKQQKEASMPSEDEMQAEEEEAQANIDAEATEEQAVSVGT